MVIDFSDLGGLGGHYQGFVAVEGTSLYVVVSL
jgi:hypothetical protein